MREAPPRGGSPDEADRQRRHRLLLGVLALHVPVLAVLALAPGRSALSEPTPLVVLGPLVPLVPLVVPTVCVAVGYARRHAASSAVTVGLVASSAALVLFGHGVAETHLHLFVVLAFLAVYQDRAPLLLAATLAVVGLGAGSVWRPDLILGSSGALAGATPGAAGDPWLWASVQAVAVLSACVGLILARGTQNAQRETQNAQREHDAPAGHESLPAMDRAQFTSQLLTNLARRNQSLLYRQLEIINQLEEVERDPDALAGLFVLDHLATRVRRNAENLLVLSGDKPPRSSSDPVPLRDVVRASIAETEDLDRVVLAVEERVSLVGHAGTDLTHLIAELSENAVRFSPPDTVVTIRMFADRRAGGGYVLAIEDRGVGMRPEEIEAANELLADPPEVDMSVAHRLGFHVVARLARRHGIRVTLGPTPGSGVTAVVGMPTNLFVPPTGPGPDDAGPDDAGPDHTGADDPRLRDARPDDAEPDRRPAAVPAAPAVPLSMGAAVGSTAVRSRRSGAVPFGRPADLDEPGGRADRSWSDAQWWSPAAASPPPDAPPLPAAPAAGSAVGPAPSPGADVDGTGAGPPVEPPGLRKRIPQSHLHPDLRLPLRGTRPAGREADRTRVGRDGPP